MRARLHRLPILLTFALIALPLAALAEEVGTVTARSPVILEGASVTRLDEGIFLLQADDVPPVELRVEGARAVVTHIGVTHACRDTPGAGCVFVLSPDSLGGGERERRVLDDVVLSGLSAREGVVVAVSNVPSHGTERGLEREVAPLFATAGPVAQIAVEDEERQIHRQDPHGPWSGGARSSWNAFPAAEAGDRYVGSDAWTLEGDGWLRIVLSGLDVQVNGQDEDGAFAATYKTGSSEREEGAAGQPLYRVRTESWVLLEIEATSLSLSATAPARAYGSFVTDLSGAATFYEASGEVPLADGTRRLEREDATLRGDLTLAPVATVAATDDGADWIVLGVREAGGAALAVAPAARIDRETATAVAGGALLGLLVAGAAAWYWPNLRYLGTVMLLPLYTRIGRQEVLQHGKREEIFQLIQDTPGIHAHDISARTELGWGTTVYHLRLLENHGLVVGKRTGRYKRFFATAGGAVRQVDSYAVLRNETTAAIARHVLANPGCIQKDVCGALGLAPSLVTWHMNRLEGVDLVKKVRDGRTVRYYAGGSWAGLQIGFAPTDPTRAPALVDAGAN